MSLSQQELASTLKHLKRAPAPKVPVAGPQSPTGVGPFDLSAVKLKKTGKRESLIAADMDVEKENGSNELNNIFAKRKMFEQGHEKPATLPRIAPKPSRRISDRRDSDTRKSRSDSLPDSTMDSNENLVKKNGVPTLRPLPTLQSVGLKPPPKPPKPLILTMKIEKKYKNHKVMIAPKVKNVIVEEVKNGTFDQVPEADDNEELIEEDIYDDINTGLDEPVIPVRPLPPPQPIEPEPIDEDTYDDVEQLAEVVKAQLAQESAQPQGRIESFHVDGDEQFGEDFYQPVEGTFSIEQTNDIEPADMDNDDEQQQPSVQSTQPSKEDIKAKRERERKEKELQKKKDREEMKRKKEEERREKEDKKKKDDERKRREKVDRDLKKTHKLKGNEPIVCKGTTKEDLLGSGKDMPCTKGVELEVVMKENCPQGKWLVKDQQGHYGYVQSEILVLEGNEEDDESLDANLDEDLYECVDTFQSQSALRPVPPPVVPDDFPEDLYDDTLVAEDEDFYDDIPGAN